MTISIGGLTCFFGCVLVAWIAGPAHSVPLYYIGRFITGFGCGVACMVLPMYNAEVATLNIRGLTGSLFQFMVVVGGVVVIILLGFIDSWGQGFLSSSSWWSWVESWSSSCSVSLTPGV